MEVNAKNRIPESDKVAVEQTLENRKRNYRGGAGLLIMSGLTAIAAGVITSAVAKKRARQYLASQGHELVEIPETGTALAIKALCYATFITFGVFSISIFGLCKWFHINSMEDLRTKIRNARKISSPEPNDRTEFENLSDFLNYLNERYGKHDGKK